jgi:hypothetical protein
VARVIAVPDDLEIRNLHEVFLSIFGWAYDPGFIIIWIHAQELHSFPEPASLLDPGLLDALVCVNRPLKLPAQFFNAQVRAANKAV